MGNMKLFLRNPFGEFGNIIEGTVWLFDEDLQVRARQESWSFARSHHQVGGTRWWAPGGGHQVGVVGCTSLRCTGGGAAQLLLHHPTMAHLGWRDFSTVLVALQGLEDAGQVQVLQCFVTFFGFHACTTV